MAQGVAQVGGAQVVQIQVAHLHLAGVLGDDDALSRPASPDRRAESQHLGAGEVGWAVGCLPARLFSFLHDDYLVFRQTLRQNEGGCQRGIAGGPRSSPSS